MVEVLDDDVNADLLRDDVLKVIDGLLDVGSPHKQLSVTNLEGDNDLFCGLGKALTLDKQETQYCKLNQLFKGTYVEECINKYPEYYRWRLMALKPFTCYSVHRDGIKRFGSDRIGKVNQRVHFPIITDKRCFLTFYDRYPVSGSEEKVRHYHLECGNSYLVHTSTLHSAMNFSNNNRIHLVGETYKWHSQNQTSN